MNWLETYDKYTAKHESPSIYHLWSAIATIAAALERKVWTPLMFDNIYPNMYIILVGPAGRCRKGSAMAMGTRILRKVDGLNICANIITRQALVTKLVNETKSFKYKGKDHSHSSVTAISSELDIIISSDRIEMLKLFTDIFDSQHHEKYEMQTIKRGIETIDGLWFHLFGATVPEFFRSSEMAASVASGFTSRCLFIFADNRRFRSEVFITDEKRRQEQQKQDATYFETLVSGLKDINKMVGEFKFTDKAGDVWNTWYQNLSSESQIIAPLRPYEERKHVHVIKVAMCLAVSENQDELVIHHRHIINALGQVEMAEKFMPLVFSGTGRSVTSKDIDQIMRYLTKKNTPVSYKRILNDNWRDVRTDIIDEILNLLVTKMGKVKQGKGKSGEMLYQWIKGG